VGDLEKAKGIKKDPSVLSQLGKSYYGLRHYDKAAPAFRDALKARPTDKTATRLLAESLINLGAETRNESQKSASYKEAVQAAEEYLQMKPNDFKAHNLCGRAALGAGEFGKAEQSFRKVLALKPDYCFAMVNLGKTYMAQQRWSDAESILNDAATCAPREALVYESLGFVIEKQKRLEEAIAQYNKAMQIKPSAGLRAAVDRCNQNIQIRDENIAMAAEEERQKEEEAQAAAEYEEAMKKQEEWEKKRQRDE
jgi:Flp pilus assembly protein TadD